MSRNPFSPSPDRSHRFGQPRPRSEPPHPTQGPLYRGSPFQSLPAPTGAAPFRLDLAAVVPDAVAAAEKAGGIELHVVGDTGGVQDPNPQKRVAAAMEADLAVAGPFGTPACFFHLGDVIYFDGQAEDYLPQFYEPYMHYDAPILAIPGNHDGDVFDDGVRTNPLPSLATFTRNFCAAGAGQKSPDSGEVVRTAMIQPNVYWTLEAPFLTVVGLYTNVPEGGVVEPDQAEWFAGELAAAPKDKALVVAMHHPIYSLDVEHSGSKAMAAVLHEAVRKAKRAPELVLAAHVHDYQRFTLTDPHGHETPFVVAGQGGYHNLHRLVRPNGQPLVTPYTVPDETGLVLEACDDTRWGFLRLAASASELTLTAYATPGGADAAATGSAVVIDRMRLDWTRRRLLRD